MGWGRSVTRNDGVCHNCCDVLFIVGKLMCCIGQVVCWRSSPKSVFTLQYIPVFLSWCLVRFAWCGSNIFKWIVNKLLG